MFVLLRNKFSRRSLAGLFTTILAIIFMRLDTVMETSIDDLVSLAKRKNVPVTTDSTPKKKKHKRNEKSGNQVVQPSQTQDAPPSNNYPYPVVPDDHCESPMEAYQDISSFLLAICKNLSKTPETLRIFDPYFCEGRMKERLNSLGFKTVYNEKKDFYESIRSNTLPEFDVLITNPPYSGDHMERLLRFCTGDQCNKPWFLLLPNYVYTKDYYANIFGGESVKKSTGKPHHGHSAPSHQQQQTEGAVRKPFYVTPAGTRRYLYTTPKGRRQEKSSKYTSPFPTFWYCQAYE